MINLNKNELRDKIYACWVGKNIGGTIGTPFEDTREINDCKGFTSKKGEPLPNDDLDLQLIWLKALRDVGPENLNAKVLGDYWMEYVVAHWKEYGICKSNMSSGLLPPLSGQYENIWKHSNGAWIRTEIWASLFPADVERAVRYAAEDASVDHGTGDGTHAAMFIAALESAAYVVNDIRELIKIGLSKIPEGCRFSKYVNTAIECYDTGKTWVEARNILTDMALSDPELGWFQAPTNVGYVIIGLLYGEGDFKKTVLTACNCGDDTDCTAATAGAILGIMNGLSVIPKDWQEYIGDSIVTIAINRPSCKETEGRYNAIPNSCTELTDIVTDTLQLTMHSSNISISDSPTSMLQEDMDNFYEKTEISVSDIAEYHTKWDSFLAEYTVAYDSAPKILPEEEKTIKLSIASKLASRNHITCRWIVPEGWNVSGNCNISINVEKAEASFVIKAGEKVDSINRLILEISCCGRPEVTLIPVVFLG